MKIRAAFSHVMAMLALAAATGSLCAQSDSAAPTQNSSPALNESPSTTPPSDANQNAPQPDAQQPAFTFRQTVRRVIVDVMVRDKDGKPVHGLTVNDFALFENGKPQKILSFDTYDFNKPSISRAANSAPLPPNVFVNIPAAPEHGPLYILLYDLVNTDMEDQMSAHGQLLKFIREKPAGTRFAVFINSDQLFLAQGFTDDKDALYALLDGKHSRPHVPKVFLNGRNYGKGDPYTVVDILTHISQYLDGIPGRKNLIWVAGSFPAAMYAREGDPADAQSDVRAEINSLAQSQVAIFPLNVRGVVVPCEGCTTGAMPNGGAGGNAVSLAPGQTVTASPVVTGSRAAGSGSSLSGDYGTEDQIASLTGGRAFYSTNDLATALEDATEDGGNYYTLTYAPPDDRNDGKCHAISVRTDAGRYQLSYRRSYCRALQVTTAADNSSHTSAPTLAVPLQAADVLQANMRKGAPMLHDLIFSAHVRTDGGAIMANSEQMAQLQMQADFFLTHKKNRPVKPLPPTRVQRYTVDYRVLDPQMKVQQRSGRQPTLEFAVAAFDGDGKCLNGVVNDGVPETSTQNSDNKSGLYRVRQTLAVPANAVSIRVGVRDRLTDRMGTIEVALPLKPEPVAHAMAPQQ